MRSSWNVLAGIGSMRGGGNCPFLVTVICQTEDVVSADQTLGEDTVISVKVLRLV